MAKRIYTGGYSKSTTNRKQVSAARLHQKSGPAHSFGGYTKVNHGNGTFTMKKSRGGK